jgi:hypothetical protein
MVLKEGHRAVDPPIFACTHTHTHTHRVHLIVL